MARGGSGWGDRVDARGGRAAIAAKKGATLIPPFNEKDHRRRGTVGLEIAVEWPAVRNIIVPWAEAVCWRGWPWPPRASIRQSECSGSSRGRQCGDGPSGAERSSGSTLEKIADGAGQPPWVRSFEIIRQRVTDIVSVDDATLLEFSCTRSTAPSS